MKLLITGGHMTPALACIDYIIDHHLDVEMVFVGRQYANDTEKIPTLEYHEITNRRIPFIHLSTGRLTRVISWESLKNLLKLPGGFLHAYGIIIKEKPNAVLSFGGYLALPIAIIAKLKGIKVYTHEQTIQPGLANKIISQFCDTVFVSFPETKDYFENQNVIVTGNPIREQIFQIKKKPFELHKTKPVLYITGGSLGAHSINIHIEELLPKLLEKYIVIHQTGNVKEYNDYGRLVKRHEEMPKHLKDRYYIVPHFSADESGYIYSVTDLVIGRSGANTFFELAALKKPALFIPLPWSARGEQQKHAEIFAQYGVGEVFSQYNSSEDLLKLIDTMMDNLHIYEKKFKEFPAVYHQQAAEHIVSYIVQKKG